MSAVHIRTAIEEQISVMTSASFNIPEATKPPSLLITRAALKNVRIIKSGVVIGIIIRSFFTSE